MVLLVVKIFGEQIVTFLGLNVREPEKAAKNCLLYLAFSLFQNVFEMSGLTIGEDAKKALELEKHGLGVITAAIFLAGEMAGSGVLALPNAMAGTGTFSNSLLFSIISYLRLILMLDPMFL